MLSASRYEYADCHKSIVSSGRALEARPLPKVRGFKPRLPECSAQNLMLTQRRFHHENQFCSIRRFYGVVQGMRT